MFSKDKLPKFRNLQYCNTTIFRLKGNSEYSNTTKKRSGNSSKNILGNFQKWVDKLGKWWYNKDNETQEVMNDEKV